MTLHMPLNRRIPIICFILIVMLGGTLRLTDLGNRPNGLFRDEAEKGYNAWALATTGGAVDFSGGVGGGPAVAWRRLPWMITVMGGKTSAIYQYASVPVMWIGGLSITTTRLTSALVGVLTVALAGLLAWRAWGAWPGLAVALWLALCPWHLNFSRWALEGIFVPFFVTLTLLGALGLERDRRWGAPLAGATLGWLFYSYSGAQPFVLAWGLCLFVIYWKRLNPKSWPLWLGAVLFLLPVIPTLAIRLAPGGSSRLASVAIWGEPGATPLGVAWRFVTNYLAHFDPRFLFFRGDLLPRHNVTGHGELLAVDLILLPVGLWASFSQRKPLRWALLAAFLCGPLPAAITREGIPHALRSLAMVVPAVCWAGLGAVTACQGLIARTEQAGAAPWRARGYAAMLVAACLAAARGRGRAPTSSA
jgi:4-amino-4-deoxy-L-arabinose transferase-like glycosyltransferase